jgi:hypothetical protein
MISHNDWTEGLKNMPKCKYCIFYDASNVRVKEFNGKIAICTNFKSGRYKIGHYSACCEFYKESE